MRKKISTLLVAGLIAGLSGVFYQADALACNNQNGFNSGLNNSRFNNTGFNNGSFNLNKAAAKQRKRARRAAQQARALYNNNAYANPYNTSALYGANGLAANPYAGAYGAGLAANPYAGAYGYNNVSNPYGGACAAPYAANAMNSPYLNANSPYLNTPYANSPYMNNLGNLGNLGNIGNLGSLGSLGGGGISSVLGRVLNGF